MPTKIKIELTEQPKPFKSIRFKVFLSGDSYEKIITKTFINTPVNSGQVKIGTDLNDTIFNLYMNLAISETDEFAGFYQGEGGIIMQMNQAGNYGAEKLLTLRPASYTLDVLIFEQETVPSIPYFPFETFAITITDTYDNDRVLIEEFTQIDSPTIKWDAGDTLYESIMASELTFNMMVNDNSDAKFKHLFTGDEKRYLVKLFFVNEINISNLAWKGFLLPDQFSEPYKNGTNFIEFVATDMIGSLKGKFLEPWFYVNRLPIAELIATILKMTGLEQEILVKPSIVPSTKFVQWRHINVNLQPYYDGSKYTDVYTILTDLLEAQALTIYSFKGFWWLDGVTRKKDTAGTVLSFDANGKQSSDRRLFEKQVVSAMFERNVPVFSGVTPWKAVEVDFNIKSDKNIFSESVVKKDIYLTTYAENIEFVQLTGNAFRDSLLKDWLQVGCPELFYRTENRRRFSEVFAFEIGLGKYPILTAMTTAETVANYFECPEHPLLVAGVEYEIDIETLFSFRSVYLQDKVSTLLQKGRFDSYFRFQLIQNDVVILQNVPEYADINKFKYDRSNEIVNGDDRLTFKIKAKFTPNESGPVTFRILHPKTDFNTDTTPLNTVQVWTWNKLQVNTVEKIDADKPLNAEREVNYTQIYNAKLEISASEDVAVDNSFGLGFPQNLPPYLYDIPTNVNPEIYNDQQYFPAEVANLQLQTFESTNEIRESLFIKDFRKAVYKQSPSGKKESFINLWVRTKVGVIRLGYLLGFTGKPLLPKSFRKIQTLSPGDVLKFMEVKYATEDYSRRKYWRLTSGLELGNESYNKTFAKAIHAVQPEAMYRLEGTALNLLFPDMLIDFKFDNQNRQFIPTTLTLNLAAGKTQLVATEKKYTIPNDLNYE